MSVVLSLAVAFLGCLFLIPLVKQYCYRSGHLAFPRTDRWHRKPTPNMGGLAIFGAFVSGLVAAVIVFSIQTPSLLDLSDNFWGSIFRNWGFLAGSLIVFVLGIYDDLKQISAPAKLIGQIGAAGVVVALGLSTQFFSPRLENQLIAELANRLLTIAWLVGITNAINLLDNMDGLAGGISLIGAVILGVLFWRVGNAGLLIISAALIGSLAGFLIHNYPPASIFMGDSGSMFLGFTLAGLAIARQPQASNVLAVLGVPTLLFLLPILDTVFVTVTRTLRGESPTKGGRDHTSHRLIAFGWEEKQVLWILYTVALISGLAAVLLESATYWLGFILLPILVIAFALSTAYLGGVKINRTAQADQGALQPDEDLLYGNGGKFLRVLLVLTFKRRVFEVLLDFFIISLSLYITFIVQFGVPLTDEYLQFYIQVLPVVVIGAYISFNYFGVYRSYWRYVGINNLLSYASAAAGGALISGLVVYLIVGIRGNEGAFDLGKFAIPGIFVLFGIFLFFGLSASRSSFKILDVFSTQHLRENDERVLILGASDRGEMALRWIQMNTALHYRPVGFIDHDPFKVGRSIHGVEVIGVVDQLAEIIQHYSISGVIVADNTENENYLGKIESICKLHASWMRIFRIDFDKIDDAA